MRVRQNGENGVESARMVLSGRIRYKRELLRMSSRAQESW